MTILISPAHKQSLILGRIGKDKVPVEKDNDESDIFGEKKSHWVTGLGFKLYVIADLVKQIGRTKNAVDHNVPTSLLGTFLKYTTYPLLFLSDNFYTKLFIVFMDDATALGLYATEHTSEANAEVQKAKKQGVKLTRQPELMGLENMNQWLNHDFLKRMLKGQATQVDVKHTKQFSNYIISDIKRAGTHSVEFLKDLGALTVEGFKKLKNPVHHKFKLPEIFNVWVPEQHNANNFSVIKNTYRLGIGNHLLSMSGMLGAGASHLAGTDAITNTVIYPLMFGTKSMEVMSAFARSRTMFTMDNHPYTKLMSIGNALKTTLLYAGVAGWSTSWMLGLTKIGTILGAPWSDFKNLSRVDKTSKVQKETLANAKSFTKFLSGVNWTQSFIDLAAGSLIIGAPLVQRYEKKHDVSLNPFSPDFVYIKNYKKEKTPKHKKEALA